MIHHVEVLNFTEALRLTKTGERIANRKRANVLVVNMSRCHDGVWRHLQQAPRFHCDEVFSEYVYNAEYIINQNR